MGNVILIISFIVSINAYSQESVSYRDSLKVIQLEEEIKDLKVSSWLLVSSGLFSHLVGFISGPIEPYSPSFIVGNTYGFTFDIMAFYKFRELKRKKQELSLINEITIDYE